MEARKQFRKRSAILAYLQATREHPSAEMVYMGVKQDCPKLFSRNWQQLKIMKRN